MRDRQRHKIYLINVQAKLDYLVTYNCSGLQISETPEKNACNQIFF